MTLHSSTATEHHKASSTGARLVHVVLLLLVAAGLLYHAGTQIPGESQVLLPCVFFTLTDWHCPGCGVTRLVHALLHGRIYEAFRYNPLLFVATPFLALGVTSELKRYVTGRALFQKMLPSRAIMPIFWLVLAYWVLRNIPVFPFTLLAPM